MARLTNLWTHAAELIDNGFSVQDAMRKVGQSQTFTTTQLADVSAQVNLEKFEGKEVWNTTTGQPVWAFGPLAGDVWVNADGTTAHTPV